MDEIFDELPVTVVTEMASGASTLVPLTQEQITEVVGDDPDPKFATYIIDGGWSKSKRYYGPDVLDTISEQINDSTDMVGYKGHISPDRDPYDFPDIQYRWLRSKIQAGGEKAKLLVKAYLLPGTKAREYADRRINVPISIRARCNQRPIKGGVQVLADGFELESIDMARPRKAGMGGKLVAVTSEMEGGNEVDEKEIRALTLDQLKTHNPLLVEKIENEATSDLKSQVSEMEGEQEKAKDTATLLEKIRKELGIDEKADVLEIIGATMKELRESGAKVREGILDKVLEKRFKDEGHRKLVRRVLASEMDSQDFPEGDDEEAKVKITEMVNKIIDEDDDLKEIAAEMEDTGGANSNGGGSRGEAHRSGSGKREIKPGYENERISVRKAV